MLLVYKAVLENKYSLTVTEPRFVVGCRLAQPCWSRAVVAASGSLFPRTQGRLSSPACHLLRDALGAVGWCCALNSSLTVSQLKKCGNESLTWVTFPLGWLYGPRRGCAAGDGVTCS